MSDAAKIETWRLLEPGALKLGYNLETQAAVSQAISLKRIADALAGTGDGKTIGFNDTLANVLHDAMQNWINSR